MSSLELMQSGGRKMGPKVVSGGQLEEAVCGSLAGRGAV